MKDRANCAQHSTLKGTTLDKNAGQKVHRKAHGSGRKTRSSFETFDFKKMRYGKSRKNKDNRTELGSMTTARARG